MGMLMQERFIAFFPTLAARLEDTPQEPLPGTEPRSGGMEQAIVLQALAYRLHAEYRVKEIDGTVWYAATWVGWQTEFPFWSVTKVRRIFRDLRDRDLVIVKRSRDYNYFALNYRSLVTEGFLSTARSGQSGGNGESRLPDLDSQTVQSGHPLSHIEEVGKKDTPPIGPPAEQLALDGNDVTAQTSPPTQPQSRRNLTREVWDHYAAVMKPRKKEPTEEDRNVINAALKAEANDVARLKRAIDGCHASDWHMGRDPKTNGRTYKTLSHILKGKRGERTISDTIEMFVEYAAGSHAVPSVSDDTLQRWKQDVRDRHNHPDDKVWVEKGIESEAKLREVGITVRVEGEGRSRKIIFEGP